MYEDWINQDFPLGPLAQPRPVYQVVGSPRGKFHLNDTCLKGTRLPEVAQIPLTELDVHRVCSRCSSHRTWAESRWRFSIEAYLAERSTIERIVDPARSSKVDLSYDVDIEARRLLARRLAHPLRDDMADGLDELHDWARRTLAGPNEQALQKLLRDNPAAAHPDWPLHWAAAEKVKAVSAFHAPWSRSSYGALGAGINSAWNAGWGHDGQDGIVRHIRAAVADAVLYGDSREQCIAAGVEAGTKRLAEMDSFRLRDQIPFDAAMPPGEFATLHGALVAAWRAAAEEEVEALAAGFTETAFTEIARHASAPVEAVVYSIRGLQQRSDAAVVHYATHSIQRDKHDAPLVVCQMPGTLVEALNIGSQSRTWVAQSFGAAEPDDTRETYEIAQHLVDTNADLDPHEAIEAARASLLLPMSA